MPALPRVTDTPCADRFGWGRTDAPLLSLPALPSRTVSRRCPIERRGQGTVDRRTPHVGAGSRRGAFRSRTPALPQGVSVLMDRAYEDNQTRQLVLDLGMTPVVPPKSNPVEPWEYDRALYKRRNEVERLFRRLKGFRRIFSRFEKLDVMFLGFVHFTLIADALR